MAVLNDETHHVANEPSTRVRRWKEFLENPAYGFRYIIGVSGTCYVGDEYFADVIYRYSLRQAMEENYVKRVKYVADMPQTGDPDEKWQLVQNRHEEYRRQLRKRGLLPLTIIVTRTVQECKDVADELKDFLAEADGVDRGALDGRLLTVYNGAPDVAKLRRVDQSGNDVEWIVAVSMLNEGWDVKRVFQIVPHERRAFNSKLLIAQVLGRGLRIPTGWEGAQPEVTVFNHDAWAPQIRHLVNEVLEIERRLSSRVLSDSPHHFDLHNIDYTLQTVSVEKPMDGGYNLLSKGYVDIAGDVAAEAVTVEFESASTGDRSRWETSIRHKTYTPHEIAVEMYRRLEEAQDPDEPDVEPHTAYTDEFPVERLEEIVSQSLERVGMTVATDRMRQKFLQALGTLRRRTSQNVRYTPIPDRFHTLSTRQRQADSVSAAELQHGRKSYFFTDLTRGTLDDDQVEFFDEAADPGSGYTCVPVPNRHDFKTPLAAVIADSDPERRFIKLLLEPTNVGHYDAWLKSTAMRFYEIDYSWKKREHTKRGKFSPDFFIKAGDMILVVEIKGNEELSEPSEENRKKREYTAAHFDRVNEHLEREGSPLRYKLTFLTPNNFGIYFQYLREGRITDYRSELDVRLSEPD